MKLIEPCAQRQHAACAVYEQVAPNLSCNRVDEYGATFRRAKAWRLKHYARSRAQLRCRTYRRQRRRFADIGLGRLDLPSQWLRRTAAVAVELLGVQPVL